MNYKRTQEELFRLADTWMEKMRAEKEFAELPDSVEYIGDDAFSGMDTTEGAIVEIGEGIQHIGNQAFDCKVRSMVIHRKFGAFQDGSYGYFDDNGDWHDAVWYGGRTENPAAIWDGVD